MLDCDKYRLDALLVSRVTAKMTMAPARRSHLEIPRCKHSVQSQYLPVRARSQVTKGDYLCVLSPAKLLLHRWENGPGGIRTRICDLDRELCYRCTTGPERAWPSAAGNDKVMDHDLVQPGPNWDEGVGVARSKAPPCRRERDKDGPPAHIRRSFILPVRRNPTLTARTAS